MIQVSGVSKSYERLQVLHDINLSIGDGEFVSIVGPSGAGKTTLLQIIGSLERPDSGIVAYDGEDIVAMKEERRARFRNRNIGFVFQFHQLLPEFTINENVAMPAMIGGKSRRESMARAAEILTRMGLADRLDHRPSQLSGGERQRAAVARALINDPKVILADEPSGSLDSQNRRELYDLFFKLRQDTGMTFVIVTHDESLAADSDRIIHMKDGQIIA
ncbi:MAG: ABC transporter ATP-binding protein [Duncaniella sp.]|nr:ABC transporter ATP-binding protein [Duncaniella sp.]